MISIDITEITAKIISHIIGRAAQRERERDLGSCALAASSMLSEDSESGGLPSCSGAIFVLVPKLKPESKLPKQNPSFSDSGT